MIIKNSATLYGGPTSFFPPPLLLRTQNSATAIPRKMARKTAVYENATWDRTVANASGQDEMLELLELPPPRFGAMLMVSNRYSRDVWNLAVEESQY